MAKLDPLLRALMLSQQQTQNVSTFAPLVALYGPTQTTLSRPAALTALGSFAQSRSNPSATWSERAERIGVLISFKGSGAALRRLGIEAFDPFADVVPARVTQTQLIALAQLPEVAYIEASTPVVPDLDESVPSVQGDVLRQQSPGLDGAGVFVTAIDTGIDWTHPDFRVDRDGNGTEEGSRIAYIWDQTLQAQGGVGNAPYGIEYTRSDLEFDLANGDGFDSGRVFTWDDNGHGTHVMGIQGGDGSAAGSAYVGMAPGATLGFVKTNFTSGDIIDAVAYLFDRGEALGMPTVVNLSLGGHFGPHDGTSGFERALDRLSGPGRIIVNSAGNEGNDPIHVSGTLHGDSYSVDFTAEGEVAALSFWYEGDADFSVSVETPGFGDEIQTFVARRGQLTINTWQGARVTLDNASQGPYPFNDDNNLLVVLENIEPESVWRVTLSHHGGPGRFDGWVGLGSFGQFSASDSAITISEPGNAARVITVGAYVTKTRWDSVLGRSFGFSRGTVTGGMAPFSSSGPTRDGRIKPDLMAPGSAVVSALAARSLLSETLELVAPDGVHAALQGTSMASPHVAGAIALMLQADPHLGYRDIVRQLRGSAQADVFTFGLPNPDWGFGKLNARLSVDGIGLPPPVLGDRLAFKLGLDDNPRQAHIFYVLPKNTLSATLEVFDALGRPVRSLSLDPAASRQGWDLRDQRGQKISGGLYVTLLVADGRLSKPQPLVIAHD